MRTISLRQFRDSIADIGEPVEVQRRDSDGNFQVLGVWQPVAAVGSGTIGTVRTAKERQAERDRILARVNRGG